MVAPTANTSVRTNIAIRLIQLHLCVIYLFGGIGKMRGGTWWDGSAIWFAVGNLEYQSLDMTWIAQHSFLMNALAYITVFWEDVLLCTGLAENDEADRYWLGGSSARWYRTLFRNDHLRSGDDFREHGIRASGDDGQLGRLVCILLSFEQRSGRGRGVRDHSATPP